MPLREGDTQHDQHIDQDNGLSTPSAGLPTELNLFPMTDEQVFQNMVRAADVVNWRSQAQKARAVQAASATEHQQSYARLKEYEDDNVEAQKQLVTSITCGLMYTRLYDEMKIDYPITDQQFLTFFRMVVNANTKYWEWHHKNIKKKADVPLHQQDRYYQEKIPIVDEMRTDILADHSVKIYNDKAPSWMPQGFEAWADFLISHVLCDNYLARTERSGKYTTESTLGEHPKTIASDIAFMVEENLPEWYKQYIAATPGKFLPVQVVEKQLDEDLKSIWNLEHRNRALAKQRAGLIAYTNTKGAKLHIHGRNRLRSLFPDVAREGLAGIKSFKELLLYFHATDSLELVEGTDEEILEHGAVMLAKRLVKPEAHYPAVIEAFVGSRVSPECMAVFLEHKLNEATVPELLDQTGAPLDRLLEAHSNGQKLRELKSISNKMRRILQYELFPLIQNIPPQDVQLCLDEMQTNPGNEGTALFVLAEFISRTVPWPPGPETQENLNLHKTLEAYAAFSREWLKENKDWLIKDFGLRLFNAYEELTQNRPEEQPVAQPAPADESAVQMEQYITEMQEEAAELQTDPFSEWKFYYTLNERLNLEKHLNLIQGNTAEEWLENFEIFLKDRRNKVVCPEPKKIAKEFKQLIDGSTDDVTEWTRMKLELPEFIYNKLWTYEVRICYLMDQVEKSIIFFLFQKKGMKNPPRYRRRRRR